MLGSWSTLLCRLALALLLAASLSTQETARWIADLGDPQVGEAAERALLQLGEKASKPLEELLEAWDTTTPRDVERLRAALRVIDLLGEPAAALAPILTATGKRETKLLQVELRTARASLYPYVKDDAWPQLFHRAFSRTGVENKAAMFVTLVRMAARSSVVVGDAEAMRQVLARDEIFAREVAAEALGRLGDAEAIEPLRMRLLDRDRRPDGWDQIRHNGFVVPSEDQFRLRAGAALVALAPDDPRSAIGHACLALLHPHRAVRLDSLRGLARFGPDVAPAVPELLQIAQQDDDGLAAEALKVLGMAGRAVGPHLAAIEILAVRREGPVQKLASGLAARLRAMGITPAVIEATGGEAERTQQELVQATATLADATGDLAAAAEARLLAAGAKAWPVLVARYRKEQHAAPDRLVRLLGRVGQSLPEADREEVRFALANQGDTWSGPSMSSSSGGGRMQFVHQEAYARLTMGNPATLEALAGFLNHDNAVVRLVAARELAGRRAEVAAPGNEPRATNNVREALFTALHAVHPARSQFDCGKSNRQTIALDLDTEIEAAAAAALLDCAAVADNWPALLRKVLPYDDAAVVALAIERWACLAVEAELVQAVKDPRPEVGKAAAVALARLRGPK